MGDRSLTFSLTMTIDTASTQQTLAELRDLYRQVRTIAVIGASANPAKAAHNIPAYLQSQGYRIIPINPRGGTILGERVYTSLAEVDIPVDLVDVFRPPAEAEGVVSDAISFGVTLLWFQPGTDTEDAARAAAAAGLTVITGRCIGEQHGRLGLGPGPHGRHDPC